MCSPIRIVAVVALVAGAGTALIAGWPRLASEVRDWANAPAELDAAQTRHARLKQWQMDCYERFQFNAALVEDLIAGRVRLVEAVARLIEVNGGLPGYLDSIKCWHPAGSLDESVAQNLLTRVRVALTDDPSRRAEVTARLYDEYAGAFGAPPPPDARLGIP
ncbi:MAG TPA: hypothetical protein VKE74_00255 [Gemmataceae bacterium]|nr:hypothetical protein [Gemmataceae bacterium]